VGATAVGNGGKLYVNGSISLGTTTGGTQSSMAKDTTQLTASISTSATTIFTDISSGMSSASAGYFIIYGSNNAGAGFMDVVIAKSNGTPVVVSSSTFSLLSPVLVGIGKTASQILFDGFIQPSRSFVDLFSSRQLLMYFGALLRISEISSAAKSFQYP